MKNKKRLLAFTVLVVAYCAAVEIGMKWMAPNMFLWAMLVTHPVISLAAIALAFRPTKGCHEQHETI